MLKSVKCELRVTRSSRSIFFTSDAFKMMNLVLRKFTVLKVFLKSCISRNRGRKIPR